MFVISSDPVGCVSRSRKFTYPPRRIESTEAALPCRQTLPRCRSCPDKAMDRLGLRDVDSHSNISVSGPPLRSTGLSALDRATRSPTHPPSAFRPHESNRLLQHPTRRKRERSILTLFIPLITGLAAVDGDRGPVRRSRFSDNAPSYSRTTSSGGTAPAAFCSTAAVTQRLEIVACILFVETRCSAPGRQRSAGQKRELSGVKISSINNGCASSAC